MSARIVITSAATAAVLLAAGCASSSKSASSQPAGGSKPDTISVQHDRLTAPDGKTLYYNTVDTATSIKCTGSCASLWPPLTGSAKPGAGLMGSDFATVKRPDGTTQVTFRGHPLYEFADDSAGQDNGSGMADAGGHWIVAAPTQSGSGNSSAPATSSGTSGGGYTY